MFRWIARHRRFALTALLVVLLIVGLLSRGYLAKIPNHQARSRIASRQFGAARWWLEWSRRIAPDHPETEFLLARTARRDGDMEQLRQHLRRAAELGCPPERVQREQWLALAQTGQMEQAEPHLWEMLMDARGDGREICEAYAIGFAIGNQHDRAREMIRTWSEAFPDDPQPHIYLGAVEEGQEAWDRASKCYEQALQREPEHPQALLALGDCRSATKQYATGLEFYERTERAGAPLAEALTGQARCLRELGRGDEARGRMNSRPAVLEDPEAALVMAQLEVDAGEYESAARRLEPLIQREPRNLEMRFVYAASLRGLGRGNEAREHVEFAHRGKTKLLEAMELKKQPSLDVETMYNVGHAYLSFGDPAEGTYWLMEVLERSPDHVRAHEALAEYYEQHTHVHPRYEQLADRHRAEATKAAAP